MLLERTIPFAQLSRKHRDYILGGLGCRMSVAEGAIRCIDGDTLIFDPVKKKQIKAKNYRGGHVYAFDGQKLVIAEASRAIRFTKVALYEVITRTGQKIVVSEGHRLLTPVGWKPISEHIRGGSDAKVLICEFYRHPLVSRESLVESISDTCQKVQSVDALSSCQKAQDFRENYLVCCRQYGEQLQEELNSVQEFLPSRGDVHGHNHLCLRRDDLGCVLADSHLCRLYNPVSIDENLFRKNEDALYHLTDKEAEYHNGGKSYEFLSQCDSRLHQSQLLSFLQQQACEFCLSRLLNNDSCPSEIPPLRNDQVVYTNYKLLYDEIVSIEYKKCDYYYDLHVPFFENFLANGVINHNSGKTIDHCIVAALYLEDCPDKIHLASGSTIGNAKLNIGVCNGFGLENLFRGRCKWGKFRDNDALFIQTQTGEKIVVFAGGGKADSYKRILGNSYGLWIATEINEHYDSTDSRTSFVKVAMGRQAAAIKPMTLWDLNPSRPNHTIYTNYIDRYRDEKLKGYQYQHFTLEDNLSIEPDRRDAIKAQYDQNSVWYRRDILGMRCTAEGLIYQSFADNPSAHHTEQTTLGPLRYIYIGVDFGGNKSSHAFVASGITKDWQLIGLRSQKLNAKGVDTDQLVDSIIRFADEVYTTYGFVDGLYCDSAEQTIINTIRNRCKFSVYNSIKNPIVDRIRATSLLMASGRLKLVAGQCQSLEDALSSARWDDKEQDDVRLDDGTSDIDSLDAFEYSWEYFIRQLVE